MWVRVPPPAPRGRKVRFATTLFYSCGTKERHPPAPLLLLSDRDSLCLDSRSVLCVNLKACASKAFMLSLSKQAAYCLLCLFSKVRVRSFRRSFFPNRTRCAELPFKSKNETIQLAAAFHNQYNPNRISPVGDGFGLFVFFGKFEDTHVRNGVIKRPTSKPRGPRKKKSN